MALDMFPDDWLQCGRLHCGGLQFGGLQFDRLQFGGLQFGEAQAPPLMSGESYQQGSTGPCSPTNAELEGGRTCLDRSRRAARYGGRHVKLHAHRATVPADTKETAVLFVSIFNTDMQMVKAFHSSCQY